ncbi:MAG: class II histone deacetylase [Gammaproteobacteria bacterium]|nr:class II histone deacetylase [Gammaproteobacteria bacterium]
MPTGFVFHELYLWHNTGNLAGVMPYGNPVEPYEHAENPDTKRRIRNLMAVSGLLDQVTEIKPRPATEAEVLRVHTRTHLEHIRGLNDSLGVDAGVFTPMGRGSYDIALLAAGGVIEAVDAVLDGRLANAYALVRPPGHHAMPELAMGFCIFCNGAIAGRHALDVRGLQRIAYVDWDVHHGNGTQAAFYDDPRALTISVHQDRCFPHNSGFLHENGEGEGAGYNINVPLPPGSGVGAYEAVFDRVVLPALEKYRPELVFVPSGFDAGAYDPLGRQMMTSEGYRVLTRKLMRFADACCGGRLVMCHEGGYSAPTVPFFAHAVIETLAGVDTGLVDPFQAILGNMGQQELQPHQDGLIRAAEQLLARLPSTA